MKITIVRFVWLLVLGLTISPLSAAAGSGKYSDGKLTLEWHEAAEGYTGTLTLDGQKFPATARATEKGIEGAFVADGHSFPFTATLEADMLTLNSGGKTYSLKAVSAMPSAAPPVGYQSVANTAHGQAWFAFKPSVCSAKAALESAVEDLAKNAGAKPELGKAFVDDKDTEGGVPFGITLNGVAVHGMIVSRSGRENGSTASILYVRNDSPADEWKALAAAVPAVPELRQQILQNQTGSIALPEGWKYTFQDPVQAGLVVRGPDGAFVSRNLFINIRTREGWLASHPMTREPMPGTIISPVLDPIDALKLYFVEAAKLKKDGKWQTLETIVWHRPIIGLAGWGNAKLEEVETLSIEHDGAHTTAMRAVSLIVVASNQRGSWALQIVNVIGAPDAIFARTLPTLMAISQSYQVDMAALQLSNAMANQQTVDMANANRQAMQQRFEVIQQVARDQEAARHRGAMDTVEMLSGYRAVHDSQTGTLGYVDYYDSNGIVNGMNQQAGYHRFTQVPLSVRY